ncbi:MAG: PIG-L family deacetylase [Muribaculaceae bacterium]|nr:PIG-L family deacetylase [Muribaculaceae bacterium]
MKLAWVKDLGRYAHIAWLRAKADKLPEFNPPGRVLILAPHPDDEAIGCGGLISRLCFKGRPPHLAIMTGGGGSLQSHSNISAEKVIAARRQLTVNSARILGVPDDHIHFLDFSDGSIAERPEEQLARLRTLAEEVGPDVILVPHSGEGWPDHLAVREIGYELGSTLDTDVWEYCVWMWYYNIWNLDWANGRSLHLDKTERRAKRKAVDEYVLAMTPEGEPWSGYLPAPFISAHRSPVELFFRVR